jgi:hypothetical protein
MHGNRVNDFIGCYDSKIIDTVIKKQPDHPGQGAPAYQCNAKVDPAPGFLIKMEMAYFYRTILHDQHQTTHFVWKFTIIPEATMKKSILRIISWNS